MRTVMVILALVALVTMAVASLNLVAGPDIKPWSDVKPYQAASTGESGGILPPA